MSTASSNNCLVLPLCLDTAKHFPHYCKYLPKFWDFKTATLRGGGMTSCPTVLGRCLPGATEPQRIVKLQQLCCLVLQGGLGGAADVRCSSKHQCLSRNCGLPECALAWSGLRGRYRRCSSSKFCNRSRSSSSGESRHRLDLLLLGRLRAKGAHWWHAAPARSAAWRWRTTAGLLQLRR